MVDESKGAGRRPAVRRSGARASLLSGGAVLFARSGTACRAPTEEAASAESDCVFGGALLLSVAEGAARLVGHGQVVLAFRFVRCASARRLGRGRL